MKKQYLGNLIFGVARGGRVATIALAISLFGWVGSSRAQSCTSDEDPACDDGKSCTIDACKFPEGMCQHTRVDALCPPDGFDCTEDVGCNPGSAPPSSTTGCQYRKVDANCDDGFACTTDGCNPSPTGSNAPSGCVFSKVDELCDDGMDCTSDGCNPGDDNHDENGCVYQVVTPCCTTDAECDDGFDCTIDECNHGTGLCQTSRRDDRCDDGFSCTIDECVPDADGHDPVTGCITKRQDARCDDYASCTDDECVPTAEDADPTTGCITKRHDDRCDDYDDCTIDGCNPTVQGTGDTGCVFERIENCCESDDDCPTDEGGPACVDNYCDTESHTCKVALTQSGARVSGDQKGSLLVFSKIEIKWDVDGNLIQDTILDFSNDADRDGVEIQAYFVNGDRQIEERHDMEGNVIEEFEPGWNTADCRFHLTKNQPHFWSAANGSNKCQSFSVLDMDGPGRLDPEASDGTRMLRGFVVMWAVKFTAPEDPKFAVAGQSANGYWEEIRWNHLKGDAVIVNYRLGSAWEYNAWAYQARCGETGGPLRDCIEYKGEPAGCADSRIIPGRLDMDGYQYDSNFDELLLDFYASGSTGLSTTGVGVMVDTDLTLHSMDVDVRQDGDGPILTKAEFEIFNQNESKFSGTRRCICCWDQTLLSNYVRTVAVPNHFLRSKLGTDKGYARIDGVYSDECDYYDTCGIHPRVILGPSENHYDYSRNTALVGLAFKILTFTGTNTNVEWAGGNLHGAGQQSATIVVDVEEGSGEAQGAGR